MYRIMLYTQPTTIGLAVDISVRLKFILKLQKLAKIHIFGNYCNYLKNGPLFFPKILQKLKAQ